MCKDGQQTNNVKKIDSVMKKPAVVYLRRFLIEALVSVRPPISASELDLAGLCCLLYSRYITSGSEALVLEPVSLTKRFVAISSFIYMLATSKLFCRSSFTEKQFYQLQEDRHRKFTTKNTLVLIPNYFAARNSSHCLSVVIRLVIKNIRPVFAQDAQHEG